MKLLLGLYLLVTGVILAGPFHGIRPDWLPYVLPLASIALGCIAIGMSLMAFWTWANEPR
jgi:hypothetical protein